MPKPIVFFFLSLFLFGCVNPTPPATVTIPAKDLLTLGVIAGSSVDNAHMIQPLADILATELKEYGITGGEVRVAGSVEEMAAWLKDGEVDVYFDSVYPALLVSEQSGARLVLQGWQFGRPNIQAVLFASRNSGLMSVDDLRGKMIAMHSPNSTAGFFLPSAYLVKHGLTLTGKTHFSEQVSPSETGFAFSGSDQDTLRAVIGGSAMAGVVDDYHFDIVFPPETTQQLVVLARTEKVPHQVVLARPGLDAQVLSALAQALTSLHTHETGKAALDLFKTSQFESLPSGKDSTIAHLLEMLAIVKQIRLP